MSASVTGNDLGSMGAPSNDGALGPLLEVLRLNTTATDNNTGALVDVEMAISALIHSFNQIGSMLTNMVTLSASIGSLRVGIERLTATIVARGGTGGGGGGRSGGGGGGGGNVDLEALEQKWIVKEYKDRASLAKKDDKDLARIEESAANIWRKGRDKLAATKIAEQQELDDLERKWIVREYNERLSWNKKQGKETEALEQKWLNREYADRRKFQANQAEAPGTGTVIGKGIGALLGGIVGKVPGAMIGSHIGGMIGGGGGGGGGGGRGGSGGGSPISAALSMMGPFGRAVAIAGTVVSAATAAFNHLHSAVTALAKSAMNYAPGIAIAMERALKDLDAVVGAYSAKAGESMIPLVRVVADYMFPAMLALGDAVALVVKSLIPFATAILQAVMPIVTLLANTFSLLWKALSPVIDFLGAIFSFIGIIIGAFAGVLQGNIDLFADIFSYMSPLFSLFATTVSQAIEMFRQLVITITSWIPYVGTAVKKALTPQSTQGLAAASSAKYGNAQSLGESAAQNAFIATSGQKSPQEEFAQQMMDKDIPNKWAMALDAQGRPMDIAVRKDDGWVGEGGGGNWNDAPQGKPLHGRNNAPIRMGM